LYSRSQISIYLKLKKFQLMAESAQTSQILKRGEDVSLPDLPEEILCEIFSHLNDAIEVARLASVCKLWYRISRHKSLWEKLISLEFGFVAPGKQKRECDFELFKILYQELRWTEDDTKKGIDEKNPFAVFYNPLSPPPSDFPSYCLNVGVFSEWGGKYYWEVHIESVGVLQIGFVSQKFGADCKVQNQLCGVGDDAFSFSWDPYRLLAFGQFPKIVHDQNLVAIPLGNKKATDSSIIGILLDLDLKQIRYSIDGQFVGDKEVAFRDIDANFTKSFIFPALSIHSRPVLFWRGKTSCRFVINPNPCDEIL